MHNHQCEETLNFVKNLNKCGERINGNYFIHADYYAAPDGDKDGEKDAEVKK